VQRYVISVRDALPNRPPYFVTQPVTEAYVNITYSYPSKAVDPDNDTLTYSLKDLPADMSNMTIDSTTGAISWVPTNAQLGEHQITVEATDGINGPVDQPYSILVMDQPGNHPPVIVTTPSTYFETTGTRHPALGNVDPTSVDLNLADNQVVTKTVSLVVPQTPPIADVLLLLDDTSSFTNRITTVTSEFPQIISKVEQDLPNVKFGVGVGRFEDYGGSAGVLIDYAGTSDRPFILNQPIITTDAQATDPQTNQSISFTDAIQAALNRTAPGLGGDWPESQIEALYQTATGKGFDGNFNASKLDSGNAGPVATQTNPGDSGDVPPFSSFTADLPNKVLPPSAGADALGGVGFRPGAMPIVLLATDASTAYQPSSTSADITGHVEGATITMPLSNFTGGGAARASRWPK
jgi:hypothetical protein